MKKFLKELTDFSGLDQDLDKVPGDNRSPSEEAITAILFVVAIVLMVALYFFYQWSSVAAGLPVT